MNPVNVHHGEALNEFLNETVPKINKVIEEFGLEDKFYISESKFNKALSRIQGIKEQGLYDPISDVAPAPYSPEGQITKDFFCA